MDAGGTTPWMGCLLITTFVIGPSFRKAWQPNPCRGRKQLVGPTLGQAHVRLQARSQYFVGATSVAMPSPFVLPRRGAEERKTKASRLKSLPQKGLSGW